MRLIEIMSFPYPGTSAYNIEDTISDSNFTLENGGIDVYVPVITGQPKNTTVNAGEIASFSVKTSGSGLTYMWQYKEKGKDTWVDWTNKKTADITVAYADNRNGMSLRCVVTDSTGRKHISDAAVLTYSAPALSITSQPQDTTVAPNTLAKFSVKATGSGLKYLWQYKEKGQSSWTVWNTKTDPDITVAYSSSRNGMSLRCKITDGSGNTVTSSAAVLTYGSASSIKITAQPQNTTVAPNSLASFSVTATGSGLKYLWQYKEKGQSSWTDWTTKTTPSITVAYSSSRNGMSLRCKITDASGKSVTSDAAVLTYSSSVTFAITAHPTNTSVAKGSLAYFSVSATGGGLKYLWQYKAKGSNTWTDWTTKTTPDINVAFAEYRNEMSFRCVITDSTGNTLTSNAATLNYN